MVRRTSIIKNSTGTLFCFSPPVMIATCAIELALAVYTVWRYRLTPLTRLVFMLFVALATFQLAEFMVCRGLGSTALTWSRIGFVAITILPPIGLHILRTIAKAKNNWMIWPGYLAAVWFTIYFALAGRSLEGHACLGNYVIFQVAPGASGLFGLYYYGLLVATLGMGWYYLRKEQAKKVRLAIAGLMLGYLAFIIPTTTANLLSRATMAGIPSIMCGFAVLLAVLVAITVLPAAAERRT